MFLLYAGLGVLFEVLVAVRSSAEAGGREGGREGTWREGGQAFLWERDNMRCRYDTVLCFYFAVVCLW